MTYTIVNTVYSRCGTGMKNIHIVLLARCVSTVRRELVAVTLQQRQHHRLLVSLLKVQYISCLLSARKVDGTGAELLIDFVGGEAQLWRSPGCFPWHNILGRNLVSKLFPGRRTCGLPAEGLRIISFAPNAPRVISVTSGLPSAGGQFPDGQGREESLGTASCSKPFLSLLDPGLTSRCIKAARSSPSPHLSPDPFDGCGSVAADQVPGAFHGPLARSRLASPPT
jgi:hypothetical protein